MTNLRRGVVWCCYVFSFCLLSYGAFADGEEHAKLFDNLFLDLTGGLEKPTGEDSTWFGSFGANWGIPLNPDSQGMALGLQFGGDLKEREDDPEYDATAGMFARNFKTFNDQQGAIALLADYRYTSLHNNLVSLRPIIGTTISPTDAIGLTGVAGLDNESSTSGGRMVREEAIDRAEAFWNREWDGNIATELSAGYQFSNVDAGLFGGQIVYGITMHCDIAIGGEINTDGNYALGISASYNIGGTGRHATLHNIGGSGPGLFTPFPKRSFPAMMHRTYDPHGGTVGSTTGGGTTGGGTTGGDTTGGQTTGGGTTGGSTGGDTTGGSTTGGTTGGGTTGGDTTGGSTTGGATGGTTGGSTGGGTTGGSTGGITGGDTTGGGTTGGTTGGGTTGGTTGGATGGSTGGTTGGCDFCGDTTGGSTTGGTTGGWVIDEGI